MYIKVILENGNEKSILVTDNFDAEGIYKTLSDEGNPIAKNILISNIVTNGKVKTKINKLLVFNGVFIKEKEVFAIDDEGNQTRLGDLVISS